MDVIPKIKSYKELLVWQKGIQLTLAVYRLTAGFPDGERYGLTSQLRRAAVSVPSNIAEGFDRGSRKDYRHFLCLSRGSNSEVETQLFIARELGYGDPTLLAEARAITDEVSRMLQAIIKKLDLPPK